MDRARDPEKVANILQIIKNEPNFDAILRSQTAAPDVDAIREELILWQKFDQKFFPDAHVGNYTSLRIPPNPPAGFTWPAVNARGITANMLVARMRNEFKVFTYRDDLDSIRSDREPVSSSYVVLVRNRDEADEELKNKSADMLAEEAISCITLPERLRLEFFYWMKTGKHLDVDNWTLSTGSRSSDGYVPCVHWDSGDDGLDVRWYDPDDRDDYIRARAVVS